MRLRRIHDRYTYHGAPQVRGASEGHWAGWPVPLHRRGYPKLDPLRNGPSRIHDCPRIFVYFYTFNARCSVSWRRDLNSQPTVYKTVALPIAPLQQCQRILKESYRKSSDSFRFSADQSSTPEPPHRNHGHHAPPSALLRPTCLEIPATVAVRYAGGYIHEGYHQKGLRHALFGQSGHH